MAIDQNEKKVVEELLKRGADPRPADRRERTPLMAAAAKGNEEILEMILNHPSVRDDMVAQVNRGDMDGWTALLVAARRGHVPTVRRLLGLGADPTRADSNGVTPLLKAVINANVSGKGVVAVVVAAAVVVTSSHYTRHIYMYDQVLMGGSTVALLQVEAMRELIQYAQDSDPPMDLVNHSDNDNRSALFYAVAAREKEILVELLQAGATSFTVRSRIYSSIIRSESNSSN